MKRDHNITRITKSFDKLSSAIDELTDLGVIRSRKYLPDFAEWLVAQLYSGKLAESKTQKYWDIKIKSNKVQVKAHSKAVSNSNRWTPIKDINKFDILVIVVFTVNFKVRELYHIPTQKLKPYLKPYKKNYKVNWNEIKEWEVKKDSFHPWCQVYTFYKNNVYPWCQIFIIDKSKKGIEKKDDINYNMCHTHPGQMLDLDSGSYPWCQVYTFYKLS